MVDTTRAAHSGRGCGFRARGGTYLCTGQSMWGRPIEDFILDPVRVWPEDFQRGFKVIPTQYGYNNVIIFVGQLKDKEEGGYPSPWDFVEEVRHFGASRKVPPTFPFHQLTPGKSDMIFVHPKAYMIPDENYFECLRPVPLKGCKQRNLQSDLWEGIPSGFHPVELSVCTFSHLDLSYYFHPGSKVDDTGTFTIEMPSFSYSGTSAVLHKEFTEKVFLPGAFLRLKLTHIEFPFQPNLKAQEEANKAGFETVVTEW